MKYSVVLLHNIYYLLYVLNRSAVAVNLSSGAANVVYIIEGTIVASIYLFNANLTA